MLTRPCWHLLAAAVALAAACSDASAPKKQAPPPPDTEAGTIVLGLSVNHDGSQRVLRGWPLVLRVSASLDAGATSSVLQDGPVLRVLGAAGSVEPWNLEAPSPTARIVLDDDQPSAEVVRLLSAASTTGLTAGPRTIEVTWGKAKSSFDVTVEDPPADEPWVTEAKAMLAADELLERGQLDAAIAALDAELVTAPDSVALLNQRALVRERAGDAQGAIVDAQAALAAFQAQYPDATEPPVTILQITQRLASTVLGGEP